MVISIKDTIRHFGISLIMMCAVLISTMFINYYLDILDIKDFITDPVQTAFYDAQVSIANLLSIVCGSILLLTSVILLAFYIKQYIDGHKKELGILKALGYSNIQIAKSFWVLGINVFVGTGTGYGIAYALMGKFYEMQNKDSVLPTFEYSSHSVLLISFVVAPTLVFMLLSVLYAALLLRRPVMGMIKDIFTTTKHTKYQDTKDRDFKSELKSVSRNSNKLLVFFIMFASVCFAAISQASFSIRDYSSDMMGTMILVIGLILSITMLFISVATVIKGNKQSIAMMRVYGYSEAECYHTVLGCYRPLSYIGFLVGTAYQFGLMKVMVNMAFSKYEGYQEFELDAVAVAVSFGMFIVFYEVAMLCFSRKLKNISIKEIMLE